jgi:uncharacterized protein
MASNVRKRKRGFALLDPEKRKELARRGGQTAHRLGHGHTFTQEERRKGGERGGHAVSRDRAYMAEIGRRGGENSKGRHASARGYHSKRQ